MIRQKVKVKVENIRKLKELTVDLETGIMLDNLVKQVAPPLKDSEGHCSVYTRTYRVLLESHTPKLTTFHFWFNEDTNKCTVKIKSIPYSIIAMASSFTLANAVSLIVTTLSHVR